jgi:multidrug efflux pump subunit AcrB
MAAANGRASRRVDRKLALDRPYTFIIMALLILIMSPVVIMRTPTDIFPNINIPVVAIA